MIWSPDLRIAAEQPRLPMLVTSTVTGARREATAAEAYRPRAKAPKAAPLPAYSGGTVWALHPLPMIIGKRRMRGKYNG